MRTGCTVLTICFNGHSNGGNVGRDAHEYWSSRRRVERWHDKEYGVAGRSAKCPKEASIGRGRREEPAVQELTGMFRW